MFVVHTDCCRSQMAAAYPTSSVLPSTTAESGSNGLGLWVFPFVHDPRKHFATV